MLLLPLERVSLRTELIEGTAGGQGLGEGKWGSEKERECTALNPNIWDAAVLRAKMDAAVILIFNFYQKPTCQRVSQQPAGLLGDGGPFRRGSLVGGS